MAGEVSILLFVTATLLLTSLHRYGTDERLTEAYAPDIWNDY